MKLRTKVIAIASTLGLSSGLAVTSPAQASTTVYACPTSAGAPPPTGLYDFNPTTVQANPITELVGCTTSYTPPRDPGNPARQTTKSATVYFSSLPGSTFSGNVFTIRVVATPDNNGMYMNVWVDKTTPKSGDTNPDLLLRDGLIGVPGESSPVEITVDFPITVTDPAKKAQILSGNFVVQINMGGVGPSNDSVRSVSIAHENTFVVSFNSNGGSGTMSVAEGETPGNLPLNTFTRDGYLFNGWNDDQNGNGVSYADGGQYSFASDTTLYAQWIVDPNAPSLPSTGFDPNALGVIGGGLVGAGILLSTIVVCRRLSS